MKRLYIDFDGVILDTITVTYDVALEKGIDLKNAEESMAFYQTVNWSKLLNDTPEINNSIEHIQTIIDSNRFEVSILTHVVSLEEAIAKIKFIRKYFQHISIIPVPKRIAKAEIVDPTGAILIDDYAGNLREWENAGGIGVRFSTKLNGKGFFVIDQLDQILSIAFDNQAV